MIFAKIRGATYLVQLNHVGVTHLFKYVDFPGHALDVGFVFDLILLQNLYCDLFVGNCMSSDPHFPESPLSQ